MPGQTDWPDATDGSAGFRPRASPARKRAGTEPRATNHALMRALCARNEACAFSEHALQRVAL